ncbi:MAG: G1 family glutamic endopeptidase [Bryobacteraceae bacterium]|jgi:hypothetical protein
MVRQLGVLTAIAILPAIAQDTDMSGHAAMLKALKARTGPARLAVQHDDGTAESYNWSGYAVTGTNFTKATGSWIEPVVKCNAKADTEWAVFWVGIDGWGDDTVEQIGTYAYCSEGRVQHAAWWEFYPTNDIQEISTMTVKAGDRIATSVTFTGSEFVLEIKDETTGKAFSHKGTQSADRISAEWIAESPCCLGNAFYPLPDFGTVLFGKDSTGVAGTNNATEPSHSGAFNTFPAANVLAITKINESSSVIEAVPSAPSSDGTSFSITWVAP